MNKQTFAVTNPNTKHDTVNSEGAPAFSLKGKELLVSLAVNGFLNGTFYKSADQVVDNLKDAVNNVSPEFAAKTAIYARKKGAIKDAPAYIMAQLSTSQNMPLVSRTFGKVINNGRMIRNYVQVIRSGKVGRKSLGSGPKRLVKNWIMTRTDEQLLYDSIGNDPSLKDLILLSHPKTKGRDATFKYILGHKVENREELPRIVLELENARQGNPNVDWELLASLDFRLVDNIPHLPETFWNFWATKCSWTTLRMNLNTLERNGVFKVLSNVNLIAKRLADKDEIVKANPFPFQIYAAYANQNNLPPAIVRSLKKAFEISMKAFNMALPSFGVILIDESGSMASPVTGFTGRKDSSNTCSEVAALFGACFAKNIHSPRIFSFDTGIREHNVSVTDDPLAFARGFKGGGGTDTKLALTTVLNMPVIPDFIYLVSDNEGWVGEGRYTNSNELMKKIIKMNPNIKIVLHNLVPGTTTPKSSNKNVMNIGGFTNEIFENIVAFVNNENSVTKMIQEIEGIIL
jgi:60 kDa SS-A/Ro ribonucleoprotein